MNIPELRFSLRALFAAALLAGMLLTIGCVARRAAVVSPPASPQVVSVKLSRQEALHYELGLVEMRLAEDSLPVEERERLLRQKLLLETQIQHDKKASARRWSIIGVTAVLAAAGVMAGWGISH